MSEPWFTEKSCLICTKLYTGSLEWETEEDFVGHC